MARNTSSTELGKRISALSRDVVDANIHWLMYRDLVESLQNTPLVQAQSNTFWQLTVKAHAETAIIHLCRVFEKRQDTLNLLEWLKTIQDNLSLFETSEFKKRLAGNAFVDSLANYDRSPDELTLKDDIKNCAPDDLLVKKLMFYRNYFFAHKNTDIAIGNKPVRQDLLPSDEDVTALLERARTIFNRYSQLFAAETFSVSIVGRDDFKFIFSCVKAVLEQQEKLIAEQLKKIEPVKK
jgi:AbiU2